jgi:uroporphyrinogen-III synthase
MDVAIQAESLVEFTPVPIEELPEVEWIFFTSRQGVLFFVKGLQSAGFAFPAGAKLAVMGEGTAGALRKSGYAPDFIGNGDPALVGQAMGLLAKDARILFPRAAESRESIQQAVGDLATCIDLVVYDNIPRTDFSNLRADALVFTSPLNVKAYFSVFQPQAQQVFFAIGATTCRAIKDQGVTPVYVPTTPSEEALAQLCQSVLKSN